VTVTLSETGFRSVGDLALEMLDQHVALDWSVPGGSLGTPERAICALWHAR
jgi:hypothetical protein